MTPQEQDEIAKAIENKRNRQWAVLRVGKHVEGKDVQRVLDAARLVDEMCRDTATIPSQIPNKLRGALVCLRDSVKALDAPQPPEPRYELSAVMFLHDSRTMKGDYPNDPEHTIHDRQGGRHIIVRGPRDLAEKVCSTLNAADAREGS